MRRSKVLSRAFPVMLALSLALSGVGGLVAAAESPTLVGDGAYSGLLSGNSATGSFALYRVTYPGEGILTATLRPVYGDAGQADAFGMVLYTSDGRQEFGVAQSDGAYFDIDYAASAVEGLVIQVFNYNDGDVTYDLEIEGAAEVIATTDTGAEATVTETEEVTPEVTETEAVEPETTAPAVAEPTAAKEVTSEETTTAEATTEEVVVETVETASVLLNISNVLVGDQAGAYADYDITATDASPLYIAMEPAPIERSYGRAFGYVVNDSTGTQVGRGYINDAGVYEVTLAPTAGETYVVQVYNYAPGQPLTYSLKVTR